MSNTRHTEQTPNDVLTLFKSIEEINEDFYHNRKSKDDTVKGLAAIKQILTAHPEYMFYKLDNIRLTGTWMYCDQISPFEYTLLQGNHETWKDMLDCLHEYPHKEEMSKKLLGVFEELKQRNIHAIDFDEAVLKRLQEITEYSKHPNAAKSLDELYAPLATTAVMVTLKTRKKDQFSKDHPNPTLFANPVQWLTGGGSFENFYQTWCVSVEQSINQVNNEVTLKMQ